MDIESVHRDLEFNTELERASVLEHGTLGFNMAEAKYFDGALLTLEFELVAGKVSGSELATTVSSLELV